MNIKQEVFTVGNNPPKVLILFPTPIATIPPSITYVASRFKQNGFEVKVHINTFRKFLSSELLMESVVKPYKPDIVGLSYGTFNLLEIYHLQKLCKQNNYMVLAGGNHPTIKPEEVLNNNCDFVFRGEAELSIDAFCQWYKSGQNMTERINITGISYIDENNKVVHNKQPERILDLDTLGGVDYSLIDVEEFRLSDGTIKGLNVIACGRGCPFHCTFCSHSDWYKYTTRSVDNIIKDMVEKNERYGINTFWMMAETFTINKDFVYEFCHRLIKENLPFKWLIGTRISNIDEKLLNMMKDAGLIQIIYGIESFNDETLKKIKKGYNSSLAYENIIMTGKIGIPIYINLMTGFPWETPEHVEDNINYIKKIEKYVSCFQLYGAVVPYPDTEIYEEYHEKEGFTEFWLREKYQNVGMVIYQNVANPYKVSTYFQRYLFDDTYVAEDYFFKFTPQYKRAVAKMGLLIGWKAIEAQYRSPFNRYLKYSLGYGSRFLYDLNSSIEKKIIGSIFAVNKLHDYRATGGVFIKK